MMVSYVYDYCTPLTTSELVPIELLADPLYLFVEVLFSYNYAGIACAHC